MVHSDSDDDGPPPLEDMTEYLASLNLLNESAPVVGKAKSAPASSAATGARSAVDVSGPGGKSKGEDAAPQSAAAPKPLRRGFFDAPAAKSKPTAGARSRQEQAGREDGGAIPYLKGSAASGGSSKKDIPAMFKVDIKDGNAERLKSQLLDAMKPTPDLMAQVANDASVMEGFDDPEVMAAVNEVAKNSAALARYKDNPKVVKFYTNMCRLMGDRLQLHDGHPKNG